jgi:hypothetical protein
MGGMGGVGGYGGMGGIGSMGAPLDGFIASMVAPMLAMPTTNDDFVPSPIHTTHAHVSEVAIEDETKDGDVKDDGEDDED